MMFSKGAFHKSSARKVKESRKHQEAEQAASYETMLPLLGSGLVQRYLGSSAFCHIALAFSPCRPIIVELQLYITLARLDKRELQ